jgi:hypothetical protein
MQPKTNYPRWYHTFRGFVIGIAIGCAATSLAYELQIVSIGNLVWQQVFFPLVVYGLPWFVLALFEIYFGIQRYRALRKDMDRGTAAA